MPKNLAWKQAIARVLAQANSPMHYKDIADQILSEGLRTKVGATPAATVASNLSTSLREEGDNSPFQKVGRAEYILRTPTSTANQSSRGSSNPEESDSEAQYEIITSFGMFWRRDLVDWTPTSEILGMQQIGAEPVNFNSQVGIYLLYDSREVIYVGRATDRPIGRRLYEHTVDRLATRWDRFSWFGLLPVADDGDLGKLPPEFAGIQIIPALEAILIEALEPRQNRKRGDDLAAVEYLQKEDPEILRKKKKALLEAALEKV